jgi:uncharacterized C2H2 Zn-finger protein
MTAFAQENRLKKAELDNDNDLTMAIIESAPRTNQCNICKKTFANLRRHERSVHRKPALQCPVCKKKMARQDGLNRHMLTHAAEIFFSCDHCSLSFKRKDNLLVHIRKYHIDILDAATLPAPKKIKRPSSIKKRKRPSKSSSTGVLHQLLPPASSTASTSNNSELPPPTKNRRLSL